MRTATRFVGLMGVVYLGLGGCGMTSGSDGAAQDSATTGGTSGHAGAATGGRSGAGGSGAAGVSGGGAAGARGAAGASALGGGAAGASALGGGAAGAGGLGGAIAGSGGGLAGSGGRGGVGGTVGSGSGGDLAGNGGRGGTGGASGGAGGRGSGGSVADGGVDVAASDAASDANVCGPNPAEVTCLTSKDQCVPSSCSCTSLGVTCTADCRKLPMCADAGTGNGDGGDSGVACGSAFCAPGEYCCNANCGLCARMGAACIQVACEPPASWACRSDSDCQLKSDYCGGCNCRVLGVGGSLATCTGSTVQCLVDPCANKLARCQSGRCALVAPP